MDAEPFTLEVKDQTPAVVTAPSYGTMDLRRSDCMDMMAEFPDGYFDLAIVDPPYGIGVNSMNLGSRKSARPSDKKWDNKIPKPDYFLELFRVSKTQIIWGGNYMIENLKSSPCWLIWDKMQEFSGAAFEMAWTSFNSPAKAFRMSRVEAYANQDKFHPTQKPVALYQWLLANYAKPGQRILDTHLGSGSHAIACYYAGMHLTACEIDEDYFKAASERIERETAQTVLF
jgi:site-specific DNA-methyltransferase (adenine-specific)